MYKKALQKILIKKYHLRQKSHSDLPIKKVALLYYIPSSNKEKYKSWVDGFTEGLRLLEEDYDIDWINLYDSKPKSRELNSYDFILVKSCWNWIVDRYLRQVKNLKTRRGIVVSCSKIPQEMSWVYFYDVVWHQTFWYKNKQIYHPNMIHAFGVNSKDFKSTNVEKDIDILGVGALTAYKRFSKLISQPGNKKVIVGDTAMSDSEGVIKELEANNIIIKDYCSQEELASIINRSKKVYLPCEINGGGERAVLESRLCNVEVLVEPDNPKLKELKTSPLWTERHYGNQIRLGIESLNKVRPKSSNRILTDKNRMVGRDSFHNGSFSTRGDQNTYIGNFCSFGKNVTVITSNHDINFPSSQGYIYRKNFNTKHPGEILNPPTKQRTKGDVIIGNDVWIGDNVTVLSGVTIGDGAAIATGTIVTKDILPYEVHGGVPNKLIKKRFSEEVINFLLQLKWWNWSDKKIKNNETFFKFNLNDSPLDTIVKSIK